MVKKKYKDNSRNKILIKRCNDCGNQQRSGHSLNGASVCQKCGSRNMWLVEKEK